MVTSVTRYFFRLVNSFECRLYAYDSGSPSCFDTVQVTELVPPYLIFRSPTDNWGFIAESCWAVCESFRSLTSNF
jgi:hypothetical protein